MKKRLVLNAILYPGSFDPVTKGHIDVIQRLRKLFSRVLVLVADSPRKNYLFTSEERVELVKNALRDHGKNKLKGIDVLGSKMLTVEFAKKENISVIARSVRTVADWEYEYAMADANRSLLPTVETLFIMADPKFGFISSSLVREVAAFGGDTRAFVPKNVDVALKKKHSMNKKRGSK
jgi:pantetheine-phosphate adenylyltransferase